MATVDLTKYDIILCLDKSGSMGTKDCPGGKTRWAYAQEATEALARKAEEFDNDGLTVIPFANNFKVYDGVTSDKVHQVFTENEPNGGTDTAKVLEHVLSGYLSKKPDAKPIIVAVVTDGEPNDKAAVAKPMFPISVVAEQLQVHQRTLRIYDDEKILVPGRSPKNRRLYSWNDIERGKFIQYMTRELGINLAGIKIIFELLKMDAQTVVMQTAKEYPGYTELLLIKDLAEGLNITPQQQAENKEKLSRRGRKPRNV